MTFIWQGSVAANRGLARIVAGDVGVEEGVRF